MKITWQYKLAGFLVLFSILLYGVHYLIFHDLHHILLYVIGDIAFLPVEVLLVTLVLHGLLSAHERRSRLEKLNMVIGAFFSEAGTELLTYFSDCDPKLSDIKSKLVVKNEWSSKDFEKVSGILKSYDYNIVIENVSLKDLSSFLVGKRDFLLRLLENPNLLEHESFTDLLRAVFHLTEELEGRVDFKDLPAADLKHISGDIKRAYGHLVIQWLEYMHYLKDNYPFLFSLAIRTNPFDKTASIVVKS